ncbi:MAG: hypothetical protein ACRENG_14075, partial [bacterium]
LGFNVWQIKKLRNHESKGVEIELFSTYLENAYHLFIRLSLSLRQELRLDLSVNNKADSALHDMRYVPRRTLTSGLTFLKYMTPKNAGKPHVIFKKGLTFFHNDTTDVGMYFLRQPDAPTFPLVVSYPKIQAGILLNKEHSQLNWSFKSSEEALAFMQTTPVASGDSLVIFRGVLKPFRGDWHNAFAWWRAWLRSQMNFSYYHRAGHQQYRKKILGNFTMAFDHQFYDPENNRYRVEEFLERGRREFGGYDFILFWHAYPRLGIDSRDQWEMYQGLPDGIEGLRALVRQANAENVWIFLSYNPWDVIGRRKSNVEAQMEIMKATAANGAYLDILRGADTELRATFDKASPDLVFSSENRPSFKGLEMSTGSQEDHDYVNEMPRIDLLKFLAPEHNISNTERSGRNRLGMIRNALFNFVGFTVWEDIFGEINRYSWDERVLIFRYNRLVHDHIDAFLDANPHPLIATASFAPSPGRTPFESSVPRTADWFDAAKRADDASSGFYVNKFSGGNKVVYSLYHRDHDKVDRYHDNRIIGKLFKVDFPKDWHLVNIWEGLPAQVKEEGDERWAYIENELEDPSCVFAAMPQRISVQRRGEAWIAAVSQPAKGTLRLVDMDTEYRPIYKSVVPASGTLEFRAGDVQANVAGYVMIQYLEDEVVRDAVAVKVKK